MIELGNAVVDDFISAAKYAGLTIAKSDIEVSVLVAPHSPPPSLPHGSSAVYVFMQGNRCLKVGKAGPKSNARYTSQHYGMMAPSTLAKSLLKRHSNSPIDGFDPEDARTWICKNTSRINFLLPAKYGPFALSFFEAFIQCRFLPEFEGFAAQRLADNFVELIRRRRAVKSSWKTLPAPARKESLGFEASFNDAETKRLKDGLIPDQMEDKWFVHFSDGWLNFHRSWTGALIYCLRLGRISGGVRVVDSWVNRDPDEYTSTDIEFDRQQLKVLIDELLLSKEA